MILRRMKTSRKLISLIMSLIIGAYACSPKFDLAKSKQKGITEYTYGNYQASLQSWENIMTWHKEKGTEIPGEIYAGAGKAAYRLGNTEKAEKYFKQAGWASYDDQEMYRMMAEMYRQRDNLSKELEALESYVEIFPEGDSILPMKKRLFQTYVISENWEPGLELYRSFSDSLQNTEKILQGWFTIQMEMENDKEAADAARQLLLVDKNNVMALEYMAEKYFWKAEDLYQEELKAYNKNKTHRQYRRLLNALDRINADFKVALEYFKQLYDQEARKEYARYIGNIYIRFDDKKTAEYWYGLAE